MEDIVQIPINPQINQFSILSDQELMAVDPYPLLKEEKFGDLEIYLEVICSRFGSEAFALMLRGDLPPAAEDYLCESDAGERLYTFLSCLEENIEELSDGTDDENEENKPEDPPAPPAAA